MTNLKNNRGSVISFLLIWSLGFVFIPIIWCRQTLTSEVIPDDSSSTNYDIPIFDWTPSLESEESDGDRTTSYPQKNSGEIQFGRRSSKRKRALYSILGLVTKRPHKTDSELQHSPPQGEFVSVRGKKNEFQLPFHLSVPVVPFRRSLSVIVPLSEDYPMH